MRPSLLVVLAVLLSGCPRVEFTRDIYDPTGKKVGTEVIEGQMSSEGIRALVAEQRLGEENKLRIEENKLRIAAEAAAQKAKAQIATLSVEKGQMTSLTDDYGQVTSGYEPLPSNAFYGAVGYSPFQVYQGAGVPGASPAAIAIEQAARYSPGMLPPLTSSGGAVYVPPAASGEVPDDLRQQVQDMDRAIRELLRVNAARAKRR